MRQTLSRIMLALLLTANVSLAKANTVEGQAQLRSLTSLFMEKTSAGDIAAAYRSLRPYLGVEAAPYDRSAADAADYFARVTEKAGQPVGRSHVRTETIGSDFTREIWLQKFEAAAIVWRFTFYQPTGDGWKLVGVSYSTDMEPLYQPLQ
ncbi:hypothetical protein [Marinobacter sp.]|uniref:hypothetical protein n=1 Tax=Marinobacter sp. TaxID=50741 RepID=UPI00356B02A3